MTKADETYGPVGGNIWLVCRPFLATYRSVGLGMPACVL